MTDMKSYDYTIAGIGLRIAGDTASPVDAGITGFRPFATRLLGSPQLTVDAASRLADDWWRDGDTAGVRLLDRFDFEDRDCDCVLARDDESRWFGMFPRDGGRPMIVRRRYGEHIVRCNAAEEGRQPDPSLYRFALWTAFGIEAVLHGSIPIHSSTIVWHDRAVLFLGESGTGKSTHTHLWRETIEGSFLLNDDSPIIRADGTVFGSPWSGKTPCYRNEHYPIAAIVRLSQAPHNRIRRLSKIEALGALLPSCPPSFAYDEELQDAICATLSQLIPAVPVYHLECLPDADAARLSCKTVFGEL